MMTKTPKDEGATGSSDGTKPAAKKAYRRPTLHTYGNIHAITQAIGPNGAMDGGTMAGRMMTR